MRIPGFITVLLNFNTTVYVHGVFIITKMGLPEHTQNLPDYQVTWRGLAYRHI